MTSKSVVFIASFEQDNLGVGYVASNLIQSGYHVHFMDVREDRESILRRIKQIKPIAAGFSVIFQYHIHQFRELIEYLRAEGIGCHFCAGGHFPTFRHREVLQLIPGLDSICLYEGEHTFLRLVEALRKKSGWTRIEGLALRKKGRPTVNPARPLERDLDVFPPPVRRPHMISILGKKVATILAGRGCSYNCSFCSIREFYSRPEGPVRRLRRPDMVVREMELLHTQRDCSIFLFQDDDFPVAGQVGQKWSRRFCEELGARGLADRVMWKISCRPDEIDTGLFATMRSAGLFSVYLGIESGNELGLKTLNKRLRVHESIEGVNRLKQLNLQIEFGYMLFDPSSTIDSVRENLRFLDEICSDGSAPVTFCKMLPYAGTPIERELLRTGRLKGELGFEDYDFFDPAVTRYHQELSHCFSKWISDPHGVHTLLRLAKVHLSVFHRYFSPSGKQASLERKLKAVCAESNRFFLASADSLLKRHEHNDRVGDENALVETGLNIAQRHVQYAEAIENLIARVNKAASEELSKEPAARESVVHGAGN